MILRRVRALAFLRLSTFRPISPSSCPLLPSSSHFSSVFDASIGPRTARGSRGFGTSSLPEHVVLQMPSLSPTMDKGKIVHWEKGVGDQVEVGDILCQVETDKATIDFELQEEGFVAKLLYEEGAKDIPVGAPVAVIVSEKEDIEAFQDFLPGQTAGAEEVQQKQTETVQEEKEINEDREEKEYPEHVELGLPSLSPTMVDGKISGWNVKEGDQVGPGDVLCGIETDKATVDFEIQDEGYVAKLVYPAGTSGIQIGQTIAILVAEKELVPLFADYSPQGSKISQKNEKKAEPQKKQKEIPKTEQISTKKQLAKGDKLPPRVFASPAAQKMAVEQGLDLSQLKGTGPEGRILLGDVELAVGQASSLKYSQANSNFGRRFDEGIRSPAMSSSQNKPAVEEKAKPEVAARILTGGDLVSEYPEFLDLDMSNYKRVTAERMAISKQTVPHYYVSVECEVDNLLALRSRLNKRSALKLTVNDLLIKACSLACLKVPDTNSSFMGEFIRRYLDVDISVAVQTENGLVAPVVRSVNRKGLEKISAESKELIAKARDGKLVPADYMGGTFTISNAGMYGISNLISIVNPPQACILGVGAALKRILPGEEEGKIRAAHVMTATLSCDHRVVDGAVAAAWTGKFKELIEEPESMLLQK